MRPFIGFEWVRGDLLAVLDPAAEGHAELFSWARQRPYAEQFFAFQKIGDFWRQISSLDAVKFYP